MMDMMQYYRFLTDLWRFFRKHLQNGDLEKAAKESMELSKQYGETDFVCGMVIQVVDELERVQKRGES